MKENNYEKQPKRSKRKIRKEMKETATSSFVSHFSEYFGRYFSWRKKFNLSFLIACASLCLAFIITFIVFSSGLSKTNNNYNKVTDKNYDLNATINADGVVDLSGIYNDPFFKDQIKKLILDNCEYEVRVNNTSLKYAVYNGKKIEKYSYVSALPAVTNNPRSVITVEIVERYSEKAREYFTTADLQKYSEFVLKDDSGNVVKDNGKVCLKDYSEILILPEYLQQLVELDKTEGAGTNVTYKTEANALTNVYTLTFRNLHKIDSENPSDNIFTCNFKFQKASTSPNAVKVDYSSGLGGAHLMEEGRGYNNTVTTVPNFFFKYMQNTTDAYTISSADTHPLYSGFTIQIEREYKDAGS